MPSDATGDPPERDECASVGPRRSSKTEMAWGDEGSGPGPRWVKPINQIFGHTLDHGLLRLLLVFMASSIVLIAGDGRREVRAEPQAARIVGLGATSCRQFNEDIRLNPSVQRDYMAWGQGYMSGILVGRPPGVDQGLDLNPPTFDMINQLHFLRDYCAENTSANFADAVEALYKRLRREGKT